MILNRKWLLVIALVMSLAMATGSTLAYLQASDTATNTFTVGNVSIKLDELGWADGHQPTLLPGVEIKKEPTITNTGNTDAWVWMEITVPNDMMTYLDWDATGYWTKTDDGDADKDGKTVVTMKKEQTLPANSTTAPVFTRVLVPATLTQLPNSLISSSVSSSSVSIVVSAYAIQDANFGNIDAAIAAYKAPTGTPVATADALTEALANGGEVYLTEDLDLGSTQLTVAQDTILNLNGHDLEGTYTGTGHYAMFTINDGVSMTVNGNGDMSASTKSEESNHSLAIFLNNGTLTLNGGNYTLTDATEGKEWIIATIVDNRTTNANNHVTLTVNGGTYAVENKAKNLFRNYPQQGGSATLTINNGTFKHNVAGQYTYIWNQEAGNYPGNLNFLGGTFEEGVVYEDYNGQSDVYIADGVTIGAYSGNN